MKPLELAIAYMDIVFTGQNIDWLSHVLADNFTFKGPFYEFDTAAGYIKSLKSDPPEGFHYEIIEGFERSSSACLVYQFSKPGISVPMAQPFEMSNGKIGKILLIFDSGALT